MAFSINKAYLVGNVTKDPDLKYTPNNNAVCTFNVATNRSIKKGDDWEDVATFHRVVVWGRIAEYINNNVVKGDPVVVEGRIENRSFEDKDGVTKYISEVIADNVIPYKRGGKSQRDNELQDAAEDVFGAPKKSKPKNTRGEDLIPDDNDEDGEETPF